MENIYEQFFFLKYVGLRKWFVERLLKQLEAEREAIENASKGRGSSSQTLTPHNEPKRPERLY
jgi:hypothetical protein